MTNAIIRDPVVGQAEAERLVNSVSWFHRVEVIPGLIAPGHIPPSGSYDASKYIDSLKIDDLVNQRILELGTWDGPLAYELKRRGCDVVASDIQDPDKTGFNVLRKISGFEIPYVRCSVYELSKFFRPAEFDVILYFGIFYHLKHPILSFEEIAKCLKVNGLLFTEGEGLGHCIESLDGRPIDASADYGRLDALDDAGVPLTLSYPGKFHGSNNWVLPNRSALTGWLSNAGLEPEAIYQQDAGNGRRRVGGKAKKVRDEAFLEHGLVGEGGGYRGELNV